MKIDGNEKETEALKQYNEGNVKEFHRLQDEFIKELREEYKDKDHCPCTSSCKYHGKCMECVAIHRAHLDHIPVCLRPLLNAKLKILSELTEHSIIDELKK